MTIGEVTDIFLTTENYLFRRTICDLPTNALNKIFLMLHHEIEKYDGTEDNYVAKFKYALSSRKDRSRFPDDEEFKTDFEEREIYKMNSKNKIYILERLENFGTAEDKDIYRHIDEGTYSIEHIMPQHLTPVWQKELGQDYEIIHETWLHRMANLTLTAYNSQYSNSSFLEKKNMKNGFSDSGIRLNAWVAKKDKWSQSELEERSEYLANRALEVWSLPNVTYAPPEKQLDFYTLDDSDDLSGRQIAKFTFKNTEQPVSSWAEAYQKILQILYSEDKSIIMSLSSSNDEGYAAYFSHDSNVFKKAVEIGDDNFSSTNTSTQTKLYVLEKIFKLYNEDPTDLVFYLKDENDSSDKEDDDRNELRREYWKNALPIIKEKFGPDGPFAMVNVTKHGWLDSSVGISGFSITCVANTYEARTEIYLGKKNSDENKAAYDYLLLHKGEIESKVGKALDWSRADESKYSKVSLSLPNVSIQNRADWAQIAGFQAEWAKKLFDVIVPYLTEIFLNR